MSETRELARTDAIVLAGLADRRFLWGGFGLFSSLDAEIEALLCERDAVHAQASQIKLVAR
jgi:hypothetical protein